MVSQYKRQAGGWIPLKRPEAMLMFRRATLAVACFCLTSAAVSSTAGDAWLSSDELGHYCLVLEEDASAAANGTVCLAYVQGFIAGTRMAGSQRGGPAASGTEDESFTERAIRTRAKVYLRRVEEMQSIDYCIADDVPASAVLDAITERLAATPDDSELTPRAIVHGALVQAFPCTER